MEIEYDFDGSLRLDDVVEDFFHSPRTGLYVFRHPLAVDERVLAAAAELGIRVRASAEKWLVDTPLAGALAILRRLGGSALSLPEFFRVRRDALEAGDTDMLASLESDRFLEMLDTVFVKDEHAIHHPEVGRGFSGPRIPLRTPEGRYGWIDPDDVDLETGLPGRVRTERDLDDDTIKYWDTHTDIGRAGVLMAVRGYVTSVGRMSLDLGFPADAVSPRLTIRECRRARPEASLPPALVDAAKAVLALYYRALDDGTLFDAVPPWTGDLLAFVRRHREALRAADDVAGRVLAEDLRDALGSLRLTALVHDRRLAARIRRTALDLSGLDPGAIGDRGFVRWLRGRHDALERVARRGGSVVFVAGHENPDTDAIVSAIAEAYRQHLLGPARSTFVPVVPGKRIPREVTALLGEDLSCSLVRTSERAYREAVRKGRPEWILVDHSIDPEQPRTRAIVDHHYPSDVSLRQRIPRRIVFAGSTTALVALRLAGLGLDVPPRLARILLGATLMDTEDRFPGKMTPLDVRVMDRLRDASGVPSEPALYRGLMRELVSCYDPDRLFVRDYKEDWHWFGFAVAKGIRLLDPERDAIVRRLLELAGANNEAKNLPLTLVKVVDYDDDAETIRREVLHTVFHDRATAPFRRAVRETVRTVIVHESGPDVRIEERPGAIHYWGVGTQLSRKKLAPVLELVAGAFHRYFHSPSTGLWLRRDFLRADERLERFARRRGLEVHADPDGVVVGNPAQLQYLRAGLGFLCASPAEYWRARADAIAARDARMVEHLASSRYLETLDALVQDRRWLIAHPTIRRRRGRWTWEGRRRRVRIPAGEPGLIDPDRIDPSTGLPTEVEDPRQYGTGLWRYWSPDSDLAWVLRSTIFAYDMPALDLKFRFDEALPRLAIRPCLREVPTPTVRVVPRGSAMVVEVEE